MSYIQKKLEMKDVIDRKPNATGLFTRVDDYAQFRLHYSPDFFQCIIQRFSLTKKSTVMDLGCATGIVSLDIAPYVGRVIAVDIGQTALDKGKSLAQEKGIDNIEWIKCDAENILSLNKKTDLTIIADAFHFMDRRKVLKDLFAMTSNNGGVVISGLINYVKTDFFDEMRATAPTLNTNEGEMLRISNRVATGEWAYPFGSHDGVNAISILQDSPFSDCEKIEIERSVPSTREDISGLFYSLSTFEKYHSKFPEEFRVWLTNYLNTKTDFTQRGFETALIAYKHG